MGIICNEEIVAYYDCGMLTTHTGGDLPDHIEEENVLTTEMIENSGVTYYDYFTGEQITI